MNKILTHISQQHEYRSFIRAIFDNNQETEIFSANVHGNLFEIYNQTKVTVIILPTSEYTQEFHDFITEYHKNTKIILFVNNIIDNDSIINYWNQTGIICCGKKEYIKNNTLLNNISYLYNNLYDSSIFVNKNYATRNEKIAVLLSSSDERNDRLLKDLLYPKTNLPLVLFNSATYKKPQNVGFLSPNEACEIFNAYQAIIDIDDQFLLESKACNIPSISTENDQINMVKYKTCEYDVIQNSYDFFIKTKLLSLLTTQE